MDIKFSYSGLSPPVLRFRYVNHRNEIAIRRVRPVKIRYGTSEWHQKTCFLLCGLDLDKGEVREFDMRNMGPLLDG